MLSENPTNVESITPAKADQVSRGVLFVVSSPSGGGKGTRPFYKPDKNNFAPNFSFSWDPFGEGKTAIRGGYSISYVIDSLIQTAENAAIDGNDGLTSVVMRPNINATVSGGLPSVATPTFKVPRTLKDQQAILENPTVFTIDPNLRTPYVQQWNLGIERQILAGSEDARKKCGNEFSDHDVGIGQG